MLCRMYISGRLLRKLPYVPSRYQQLSYRFFALQAFLLGVVYVMFALWRLSDILKNDLGGNTVAAEFTLFIKTRQDHLGSASILCAYTMLLMLLYLPASLKESKLFRDIAVRFVYFEAQVPLAKERRKRGAPQGDDAYRGVPSSRDAPRASPGDTGMESEDSAEERPLFCVETAAWLLELAWETYNDPVDFTNPNNYHFGIANFERVGFELIEHIFNAQHDTHCFVLQDKPRARIVVAFRGSVGTKHWMDNLRFLQTEFNLDQMMPKGREAEAPEVIAEDIDIHAAETLHDVVKHMASADEEEVRATPRRGGNVGGGVGAAVKCSPPPVVTTTTMSHLPSPPTTLPALASPRPAFPPQATPTSWQTPRGGRRGHLPPPSDAEGPTAGAAGAAALIRTRRIFPPPPAWDPAAVPVAVEAMAIAAATAPPTAPRTTLWMTSWAVATVRSRISRRR
ncbi:unnamed protein product [Laminaria digitata]